MSIVINPIKFGTDGWRGLIAADFTIDRVAKLAPIAAQILLETYTGDPNCRLIIVGFDRRFMAEDFARITAEAIRDAGFDVLLARDYAPTPALSWAAKAENALGAIVLTASHNPAGYLGFKVKGSFGGSVSPEVTQQIEDLWDKPIPKSDRVGKLELFDPWKGYCAGLRPKVNIANIQAALDSGKLRIFADVMHGAAATGLSRLLGREIEEINSNRDPLFGGGAPEPLPRYLSALFRTIRQAARDDRQSLKVGLVFDGDSDRIAAVDGNGNFLSSQILIPILIDYLVKIKGLTGEIVKTVSGSDLIPRVAQLYNLPIFETPIGYKYIADRMLSAPALLGGEESGGIGYGTHIPERDALLSALYVIEAVVESGMDLSDIYCSLEDKTDYHYSYDRIDLHLANMEARAKLVDRLETTTLEEIAGQKVIDCQTTDGYKFRLADDSWLLIRFSGTEPVLRLYCQAPDPNRVRQTLTWAKDWANS
jgi:phosphomannomutase